MLHRCTDESRYQICIRCIMDISDPEITFDKTGQCSHCSQFDQLYAPTLEHSHTTKARHELELIVARIKDGMRDRDYDCVLGVSGGIDSSYLAYQAKELGLRPLLVHVDMGWNSELAVSNIENVVKGLGFDLYTVVIDWEQMRNLQLAFFRASLPNCDIPQDHVFQATLYEIAQKQNLRLILSGSNVATESILPKSWGYNACDLKHIVAINHRFGNGRLRSFPTMSFFQRYIYYPYIRGIGMIRLLDVMPYYKNEAKQIITKQFGWRDYGIKHGESTFTKFFQTYYLPVKFGYDKRRAHLSSLILSGQLTREQALQEMDESPYNPKEITREKDYVAKKLGLLPDEFQRILDSEPRSHNDYPSAKLLFEAKDYIARLVRPHSAAEPDRAPAARKPSQRRESP